MPRRFLLTVFALLLVLTPAYAQQEAPVYEIDPSHTRVTFFVDHLGFSKMPGFFTDVTGTIRFDPADIAQARVDVRIDPKSATMGNKLLDAKLREADYFSAAKYPIIRFQGTKIEQTGMEEGKLTGTVTLRGVTRPVTLDTRFVRKSWNTYMNTETIGFSARGKISRSEFGMTKLLPDVGDMVDLVISVEAYLPTLETRQKRAVEAEAKRAAIAKRKADIAAEKEAQKKEAETGTTPAAAASATVAPAPAAAPDQPVKLQLPPSFSGGGMSMGGNSKGFSQYVPPGSQPPQ